MPTPSEPKTVQSRILAYAETIGRTLVSREEAEQRRGFDPAVAPCDRARNRSLFRDVLLDHWENQNSEGGRLVPGLLIFRAFTCPEEVSKDE